MCWLHRTVCYSNGNKLGDSGDLCRHSVFGGEGERERCDKTQWTILIAYFDSQEVGKWRNNGGVLRRPSRCYAHRTHTHIHGTFCMTAAVFRVLLNAHGDGILHWTQLRVLFYSHIHTPRTHARTSQPMLFQISLIEKNKMKEIESNKTSTQKRRKNVK